MKNIHVIPTPKPSRLVKNSENKIILTIQTLPLDKEIGCSPQHINITSDEEIKDGDWMIRGNEQPIKVEKDFFWDFGVRYYKIILTTDQDLIKDNIQAIPDEFLEWFVKNPSCEEVEVELHIGSLRWSHSKNTYKIIIPQEELKQELPQLGTKEFNELASAYFGGKPKQETLEVFAERIAKGNGSDNWKEIMEGIIEGAKWQQERYSKMGIINITCDTIDYEMRKYAIEQFKKK
tara:strand:+ start:51 stop:752 length:702 start_codon:yes stop_codon:yes gene_type:complete